MHGFSHISTQITTDNQPHVSFTKLWLFSFYALTTERNARRLHGSEVKLFPVKNSQLYYFLMCNLVCFFKTSLLYHMSCSEIRFCTQPVWGRFFLGGGEGSFMQLRPLRSISQTARASCGLIAGSVSHATHGNYREGCWDFFLYIKVCASCSQDLMI